MARLLWLLACLGAGLAGMAVMLVGWHAWSDHRALHEIIRVLSQPVKAP